MKKLILKSTLTVVMAALTGLCGVKAYEKYQTSKLAENTLLMQNIEALTEDEEPMQTGYGCFHLPCYKLVTINGQQYTQPTGLYMATSFENPYSNKPRHNHECSDCSTQP